MVQAVSKNVKIVFEYALHLLYKTTLQRQVLVKQHAADTVAVNHAGVVVYFQLVGKVGAHHYQNIIPVRRVDQAAVIAAGIHGAAFAGYIDQIRIRVGFFGVGVIRGDAARQHGVVVLLAEHIAHGIAGLGG